MSLVFNGDAACPVSIIPDPTPAPAEIISGGGFWPDIDGTTLRQHLRVPQSVTPARLREAVLGAMVTLGNDADAWALMRIADGYATLGAVPTLLLGGESRNVILYRRAIACFAKAELVARNPDLDATGPGRDRATEMEPTADELRRDGRHAVRDLVGRSRTDVELI